MEYDEKVIKQYAKDLYSHATGIAFLYAILSAIIAYFVMPVFTSERSDSFIRLVAPISGFVIGYAIGWQKSFSLRLQAQIALCNVQIEKNTRTKLNQEAKHSNQDDDGLEPF